MAKNPSPKVTTKKHLARIEKERQQTRYLVLGVTAIFVLVFALIAYGILDQKVFQYQRVVAQVGNEKNHGARVSDRNPLCALPPCPSARADHKQSIPCSILRTTNSAN